MQPHHAAGRRGGRSASTRKRSNRTPVPPPFQLRRLRRKGPLQERNRWYWGRRRRPPRSSHDCYLTVQWRAFGAAGKQVCMVSSNPEVPSAEGFKTNVKQASSQQSEGGGGARELDSICPGTKWQSRLNELTSMSRGHARVGCCKAPLQPLGQYSGIQRPAASSSTSSSS
jgi:hypothetical protein